VENEIKELSVDGGKVRLRTPLGEACQWRDYQGICLNKEVKVALFQENQSLIDWVNQQPLGSKIACLGDGHDGIWNIIKKIGNEKQRLEILDGFHLKENLYKVGGSMMHIKKSRISFVEGKNRGNSKTFSEMFSSSSSEIL
jgi:hypothetical protein